MPIIRSILPRNKSAVVLMYLVIILLGVASGLSHIEILHSIGLAISDTFIKIFKCISLPIISLSIIVTLSQCNSDNDMKRIWKKTLFYTLSTTLTAATVALVLYRLIAPTNITNSVHTTVNQHLTQGNYLGYLSNLIPENIFSPFIDHQVLSVLMISLLVGLAIRFIPDESAKNVVSQFFKGAHSIFTVITGWVVSVIPIALFGFIITSVHQLNSGLDISGLWRYLAVVVSANLVQGLLILPLFLYINKISPFATLRGMFPALSIAFFTKSSAGTLPATMKAAEMNVSISPKISRFVLPLCTSINMNGCAAFIFTTVIYLMQNNGMDVGLSTMMLWVVIATIAAIGNAGVPMGCFFLSASLLTSMNVPIPLLGLILPFYSLIDMTETALNVWSDSCIAKVIDEQMKTGLEADLAEPSRA